MANEKEQRYIVGGFLFQDEAAAAQAKKELEGMKYIREQMDMENPKMVLEVYRRVLAEDLFETPVGVHFLKEIQEYLVSIPAIRGEGIAPIPVSRQKKREPEKKSEKAVKANPEKKAEIQEKHVDYKKRYKLLLPMCIALLVIVAAMFAIEATTNNPNILNYENEIINRYEEWERQLEEKEEELKERERTLENE